MSVAVVINTTSASSLGHHLRTFKRKKGPCTSNPVVSTIGNSSTRTFRIILRIYPVPNGFVVEEMCILLIMRFDTQKGMYKVDFEC